MHDDAGASAAIVHLMHRRRWLTWTSADISGDPKCQRRYVQWILPGSGSVVLASRWLMELLRRARLRAFASGQACVVACPASCLIEIRALAMAEVYEAEGLHWAWVSRRLLLRNEFWATIASPYPQPRFASPFASYSPPATRDEVARPFLRRPVFHPCFTGGGKACVLWI